MTDGGRLYVAPRPFTEVLDRYLDAKDRTRHLKAMGYGSQSPTLREANTELTNARQELDDYLNEKE